MRNKIPKHWQKSKFEDVLQYEQPSKYIVKSTEYGDDYKTPVLTAGKSFILGYTDEKDGIFTDVPVIIFDDFTTDTKFVDFHFKVKSSAMKILKPTRNTNIKFIFYLMQTIHHKSDTHKRYWISEYAKREIPLPPLNEQNLIVKKIESCFEKIDLAISNFKKSKELIEIYKQSVLSRAFNGKLTNSNLNSWQVKKLGEICDLISGRDLEADKYSSSICDYPYLIGASNFNNGEVEITRWTNFPAVIAKKGDLLITCKGSIGEMAICKFGKLHIARQIMAVRAKDKIFNLFLKYLLHFEVDKIKKSAKGIIPGIDRKIILNLEIPLPPLSEQNLIVSEIEKRFKAADSALNLIEQNLKKAEILKQSILSKAFNGKLVKDKNE